MFDWHINIQLISEETSVFEKAGFLKNIWFSAIKCWSSSKFLQIFITIEDDMTLCQCIFSLASQMSILVTSLWLSGHSLFQLLLSMKTNYVLCKKCCYLCRLIRLQLLSRVVEWYKEYRNLRNREIFKN